ncbi:MAG: hypothetical protein ACYDHY_15450 [Acidiferrobacterales bacterium]
MTLTPLHTPSPVAVPARARGSALLFVLAALLIIALGTLFTLRGVLTDASLSGRFSARQKNIPASDLALQWLVSQIEAQASEQPLEIDAVGKPWFLSSPLTAPPSAQYWTSCANTATSTDTCAAVPLPSGVPQSAYVFAEPTGRVDAYACNTSKLEAIYYDLWVHTVDDNGAVATDTESLYKLCVLN